MAKRGRGRKPDDGWLRRYPPLFGALLATVMAVLVLPSALNVPQSNPTQTVEFAPVPPQDEEPPPPDSGNVESLGLGSSSNVPSDAVGGADGGPPGLPPPPLPEGTGDRPVTKRCVGNPPRQTGDPMSPPCVAHFDGDNGGATHRGVEGDEIRVLLYADPTTKGDDDEGEWAGQYFDLFQAPEGQEPVTVRNARRFQRFFNDRFQFYDRQLHLWVYFVDIPPGSEGSEVVTPESRRSDAADNLAHVDPFAVLTTGVVFGHEQDYIDAVAQQGVLTFGSSSGSQPAALFREFPGLIWSYPPTVEKRAELFSSYVCRQVVGRPVVDSGEDESNGGPRKLGLLSTTDQSRPGLRLLARLVKEQVEACGGVFEEEATFPVAGRAYQTRGEDAVASYAVRNMSTFQQAGITTIIWAGGYETDQSRAAGRLRYFPEWVLAGDGQLESNTNSSFQDQEVWQHAWTTTPVTRVRTADEQPCRLALREADPSTSDSDADWACANSTYYEDLRQLATGIQVAGPRLTPESIDQGFHAIPQVPSGSPYTPACFYEVQDYTCVKDATREHWDPTQTPEGQSTPGCWRMVAEGRRHLAGGWPDGNLDAHATADDPCNRFQGTALLF